MQRLVVKNDFDEIDWVDSFDSFVLKYGKTIHHPVNTLLFCCVVITENESEEMPMRVAIVQSFLYNQRCKKGQ